MAKRSRRKKTVRAKKPKLPRALTPTGAEVLRQVSAIFHRSIPSSAYQTGHYAVDDSSQFAGIRIAAGNGLYRVSGADWIMQVKGTKLVGAERATPQTPGVINVPAAG